jgi:hypothetical protein
MSDATRALQASALPRFAQRSGYKFFSIRSANCEKK